MHAGYGRHARLSLPRTNDIAAQCIRPSRKHDEVLERCGSGAQTEFSRTRTHRSRICLGPPRSVRRSQQRASLEVPAVASFFLREVACLLDSLARASPATARKIGNGRRYAAPRMKHGFWRCHGACLWSSLQGTSAAHQSELSVLHNIFHHRHHAWGGPKLRHGCIRSRSPAHILNSIACVL